MLQYRVYTTLTRTDERETCYFRGLAKTNASLDQHYSECMTLVLLLFDTAHATRHAFLFRALDRLAVDGKVGHVWMRPSARNNAPAMTLYGGCTVLQYTLMLSVPKDIWLV